MGYSPSTINSMYQQAQVTSGNPYFNRARYQAAWDALLADQRADKERLARLAIAKKAQAMDQRLTQAQLDQAKQQKLMGAVRAPFEAFKTGHGIYKQGQDMGLWGEKSTSGGAAPSKPAGDAMTAGGINYAQVENPLTGEKSFEAVPKIFSDPTVTSPGLSIPGQLGAGASLAGGAAFSGLPSLYASPAATTMPLTAPSALSVPATPPPAFTGLPSISTSPTTTTMPMTAPTELSVPASTPATTTGPTTNYSGYIAAANPANRYSDWQMSQSLLDQSIANEGMLAKTTPYATSETSHSVVGGSAVVGGALADYYTGGLFSAAKPALYEAFGPADEFMGQTIPFDINSIFG